MTNNLTLAERVGAATGPDRELDRAIFLALGNAEPDDWNLAPEPRYTGSLDAAMSLIPERLELAIYTNWPLCQRYEPQNADGSWPVTPTTPRGCWVRTYGGSESGALKNVRGLGHSIALAVTALALRSHGSGGEG